MKLKYCYACKAEKSVGEFYRDSARPDGLKNICRECDGKRRRIRIAKERSTPEGAQRLLEVTRVRLARYRAKGGWKRSVQRNPQKQRARQLLRWYVKSGKINKPTACAACGVILTASKIHGHHTDYSKPLDVKWLCEQCHLVEHFGDSLIKPYNAAAKQEGSE